MPGAEENRTGEDRTGGLKREKKNGEGKEREGRRDEEGIKKKK